LIRDALDSVEGQSYRLWEVIVVWDSTTELPEKLRKAYPYVKWKSCMPGGNGAGHARNLGAKYARGDFLLFLDADDWLYPDAIDKMFAAWSKSKDIVYTDYVGKAVVEEEYAKSLGDRLLYYEGTSGEAVIMYQAMDYDCTRAIREPNVSDKPYVWNLITSLVPKSWHNEIGGFDESMESLEDWDYWLRMARAGKCFHRIEEPLVVYRFYTGKRRERSADIRESLVKYLLEKYEDDSSMPCNCSNRKTSSHPTANVRASNAPISASNVRDGDFILCKYMNRNKGQHAVIGAQTGRRYGYRGGGDIFYVHIDDIRRSPNLFSPIERRPSPPQENSNKELPPPEPIEKQKDLSMWPGVTPAIAKRMAKIGLTSPEAVLELGAEGLAEAIKGVGETRAKAIIEYLETQ
jgi:glycosyltransferase involved in cell wall biosynthesis